MLLHLVLDIILSLINYQNRWNLQTNLYKYQWRHYFNVALIQLMHLNELLNPIMLLKNFLVMLAVQRDKLNSKIRVAIIIFELLPTILGLIFLSKKFYNFSILLTTINVFSYKNSIWRYKALILFLHSFIYNLNMWCCINLVNDMVLQFPFYLNKQSLWAMINKSCKDTVNSKPMH